MDTNMLALAYRQMLLYKKEMLGDRFIDSINHLPNRLDNERKELQYSKIDAKEHTPTKSSTNNIKAILSIQNLSDLEPKVRECNLCSLAKMVRDRERVCAILPTKQVLSSFQKPLRIAFIVDSIVMQKVGNSLDCMGINRSNTMLTNIITKVLMIDIESVFIIPLFKCANMQTNALSFKIQKEDLLYERKVCAEYLNLQLEYMDYAVFFGERLCNDYFGAKIIDVKGKVLHYKSAKNHIVKSVCIHDMLEMSINTIYKKEAMINLNLLKEILRLDGF